MNELSTQDFLSYLDKVIIDFEQEKFSLKSNDRSLGVIYTPTPLVNFIVLKILKMYLEEYFKLPKFPDLDSYFKDLKYYLSKKESLRKRITENLLNIKILDPACGSGRFLIATANTILSFIRILKTGLDDFEIKKSIIQNNIYGIEIEKSAYLIAKLKLCYWLYSENKLNPLMHKTTSDIKSLDNIEKLIHSFGIKFNLFNLDFLLEFDAEKFDVILGNPPYVENKKIKDVEFKRKLVKRFKSAYRLFDLSIVFIEKSIELLKENDGFLSMITTNKFLAADYGIKIRQLLLYNTELKEITNISSLPIFGRTAVYPIIISFKKTKPSVNNTILIKKYNNLNYSKEDNNNKYKILPQILIENIPAHVIPISGQIQLINYLYQNFKTFSEGINDVKIIYRPYGFINWSEHLNNVSNKPFSERDLLLIGTGNVGKYYIKFDKLNRIAKKIVPVSYFKFKSGLDNLWEEISSQKLIYREVATELTWVYDPGIFTNVTGLYFVKIPSFNTDKLFSLLAIMNSKFMDGIFKTLFSSLHMAGGYMRFNGSFIRRLPVPQDFPLKLSYFGKILQLLSQFHYDFHTKYEYKMVEIQSLKERFQEKITGLLQTAKKITNSLVSLLYLDKFYLGLKKDFDELRKFLNSENRGFGIQTKYLLPRFHLKKYNLYSPEEVELILSDIKNNLNGVLENKLILKQIDEILSFSL
jgi:tRNA1(Val) A37 N6-methylase TrmN6